MNRMRNWEVNINEVTDNLNETSYKSYQSRIRHLTNLTNGVKLKRQTDEPQNIEFESYILIKS